MIIDFHCDTLTKVLDGEKSIKSDDMVRWGIKGQVFAVFMNPSYRKDFSVKALEMIDILYRAVELDQRLIFAVSYRDFERALKDNKVACMLSIEGGEALEGSLSLLRAYYRLGVRSMTLTWNGRNEIADGIGEEAGGGLTRFGQEVVKEMNRLGMLVDVSHLSVKGFWDVLNVSSAPVIASHSNCKALCSHRRNLDDDQMKALAQRGGVMGITYADVFLSDGKASLEDVVNHIDYAVNLMGIDHVALGSDYDGCDFPYGMTMEDVGEIPFLLKKRGYTDEDVSKIMYQNWLEVIKKVIG
ncbi:dipeptidase [Caldanaerobius polysaccharolyticus]|uniref:dipeptidase n=1 Tax=Caldanaerobius polysaccharolyticus TaxID=44256 RepID=UPI00047B31A4|nr:dipeptidase [Caldanaerobius polysaccharolyticus]